jgi:hypothetical protein
MSGLILVSLMAVLAAPVFAVAWMFWWLAADRLSVVPLPVLVDGPRDQTPEHTLELTA